MPKCSSVLDEISQINHELLRRGEPLARRGFMNELAQFLAYVIKVFALDRVVRAVRDSRPYPEIPTRPLLLSLLLGVVLRAGSYRDIAKQTKRRRWQHLIHWPERISDDAFHYVSERFYLEDLRQSLVEVNQTLKGQQGAGKL